MLTRVLARPLRHERAGDSKRLIMRHRLAGLESLHFHLGDAIAQLYDDAAI